MIFHLVLFKISPLVEEEQIRNFYIGLENLRQVPGVINLQCGPADKAPYKDYLDRSRGYTHALLVTLPNNKALEEYELNPVHNLVRTTIIKPLLDNTTDAPVLAIDFPGVLKEDNFWAKIVPKFHWKSFIGTAVFFLLVGAGIQYRSKFIKF